MSSLATSTPPRDLFTITLRCSKCGQRGSSVWEENFAPVLGPHPVLLSLSQGFYERLGKANPYLIELVCDHCETVQQG